ncbi:Mitochondrial zinc maintenance protein 1 mitochondrial [Spathaspora sp. JA1]|nr:Mitochondrial zinc maintenance protein 1 mitochondrial [Spathaspora sp. JA1]
MTSALKAYREALRATRIVFHQDLPRLVAARTEIKTQIKNKANLTDETERTEAIKHLEEVAKFLRHNIVQGEVQENGNVNLHFREETELGDNDTIKQGKSKLGSLAGKKTDRIKKN